MYKPRKGRTCVLVCVEGVRCKCQGSVARLGQNLELRFSWRRRPEPRSCLLLPPVGGPRLLVRTVGGQMAGSPSLYSEYAMSSPPRSVGHSPTRTSRLRSNIIKLSCSLKGEADRSRATVVRLPEECDTLGEVIPKIHKRMGMDKRIAFAAELFLPDGT